MTALDPTLAHIGGEPIGPARIAGHRPVIVLDDHPLISTTLAVTLGLRGVTAVSVPVDDRASTVAAVRSHAPGTVVLDLDLGETMGSGKANGIGLIRELRAAGCTVLVVTGQRDRELVAEAIAEGAVGWISKTAPFEEIVHAVERAASGREMLDPADRAELLRLRVQRRSERRDLGRRLARLTTREREVLDRLAAGHAAADIAEEFTVSLATVRTQIRSVLTKLDVKSQLSAVALLRAAEHNGAA